MKEAQKHVDNDTQTGSSKARIIIILVVGGLIFAFMVYSLTIHFTKLRYSSHFDPLESVIYKAKSAAANTDVERAHFHISESERLLTEMRNPAAKGSYYMADNKPHNKMIWHNDEATKYMLRAEANGANLKELGLIERLCDSLGAQYAYITGIDVSEIREEDKLYTRVVDKGENLQDVFSQIQAQLQTAMNW